jgi:hypothetical protein
VRLADCFARHAPSFAQWLSVAGIIRKHNKAAYEGCYKTDQVLFLDDNLCRTCQLIKPAVRAASYD